MRNPLIALLLCLVSLAVAADYPGSLAHLRASQDAVGGGWEAHPDAELFEDMESAIRANQRSARLMGDVGVRAYGDFGYRRAEDVATIRIKPFIFTDAARCQAWLTQRTKFTAWKHSERDGWQVYMDDEQGKCVALRDNVALLGTVVSMDLTDAQRAELLRVVDVVRARVDVPDAPVATPAKAAAAGGASPEAPRPEGGATPPAK